MHYVPCMFYHRLFPVSTLNALTVDAGVFVMKSVCFKNVKRYYENIFNEGNIKKQLIKIKKNRKF